MATSSSLSSILGILIILCIFFSPSSSSTSTTPIDVSAKCTHILTTASLKNEPRDNQTLRVLVPWKVGFEQFVKFKPDSCQLDGFCIQVFCQALKRMQEPPRFKFVLFGLGNETPSYDDMIDMLVNKTVDAVVADLTITRKRMKKVGFTVPYLASSLAMVTPFRYEHAGIWDFLKPFSKPLWIALLGYFVATGIALYLLENQNPDFAKTSKNEGESQDGGGGSSSHKGSSVGQSTSLPIMKVEVANPPPPPSPSPVHTSPPPPHHHAPPPSSPPHDTPNDVPLGDAHDAFSLQRPGPPIYDQASHKQRIMNAYWFTSLCIFQAQQESIRTHLGRFVTVGWLFVMLIFNSSYTASLASLLLAQKMNPTIESFQSLLKNKNISMGYQEGSFMTNYMKKLHKDGHRVKNFASEEDYAQALRKGNLNPNGVGAVLDELPYIQILLQSECEFTKISTDDYQIPSFGGFGFAFRKKDHLIDHVSKMILEMAEDGTLQMLQNWSKIGDNSTCDANAEPSHLRLRSFVGLFCIVGLVYAICIIWRFSTKAIKSPKCRCNPLIRALPCTPHSSSIRGAGEFSLSRRSKKVSDEIPDIDHVSS